LATPSRFGLIAGAILPDTQRREQATSRSTHVSAQCSHPALQAAGKVSSLGGRSF
jgi:hypothetical protein